MWSRRRGTWFARGGCQSLLGIEVGGPFEPRHPRTWNTYAIGHSSDGNPARGARPVADGDHSTLLARQLQRRSACGARRVPLARVPAPDDGPSRDRPRQCRSRCQGGVFAATPPTPAADEGQASARRTRCARISMGCDRLCPGVRRSQAEGEGAPFRSRRAAASSREARADCGRTRVIPTSRTPRRLRRPLLAIR